MKYLIFALVICVAFPCHAEPTEKCSEREAFAAETVTDYLDSWKNVYLFFKQFNHCYDAAIAEGAQDAIQHLWVEKWASLPEMIALTNKDSAFKKFIWQSIRDETFPKNSFVRFVKHATRECTDVAKEFCNAVIQESKRSNAQPFNKPE
ncbi:hypothetical protein [uncultured Desulfobulbus sp.]|uniref:hypothetical protein n=1 Tax=uncultured Desulfobulbus sp. TaxID=239745 RepID=UPI0029C85EFA|nr:hypothetical protein [uncultured Desulfobulbus sp.]